MNKYVDEIFVDVVEWEKHEISTYDFYERTNKKIRQAQLDVLKRLKENYTDYLFCELSSKEPVILMENLDTQINKLKKELGGSNEDNE